MPANECIPTYTPGTSISAQANGGAVTGKRFVKVVAARVGGGLTGGTSQVVSAGPGYGANTLSTDVVDVIQVGQCSSSGEVAIGVAGWDFASGAVGKVYKRGVGHILPIKAGANITAGTEVQTDATGQAIPIASGKALGYAVDSAASGADCEIFLY